MGKVARFTKADLRRAMQAAKAEGFDRVELVDSPEGLKIVCERKAQSVEQTAPADGEHFDI